MIGITLLHCKINCKFPSFDVIRHTLETFLVGVMSQKGWCLDDIALLTVSQYYYAKLRKRKNCLWFTSKSCTLFY